MSGGREEGGGRVGPAGRLLGAWGPGTGVLTVTGGPWALRAAGPSAGRGGRGCCTPPGGGQRRRPPVGAGRCDPLVTSLWSNPLFFFLNIYLFAAAGLS